MVGDKISTAESVSPIEDAEITHAEVDPAAIRRMKRLSTLLDEEFRVPGTDRRIGLDPILGILPGGGDAISAGISLYIVLEAARQGVSNRTIMRMLTNVLIDAAAGSIPVIGDLFDAFYKANMRNLKLAFADLGVDGAEFDEDVTTIDIE